MPVYEKEPVSIKLIGHDMHIPFVKKAGQRLDDPRKIIIVDEDDDPYYDSRGTYVKLAEDNGEETVEVGSFCGVMNNDVSLVTGPDINKNSTAKRKVIWKPD